MYESALVVPLFPTDKEGSIQACFALDCESEAQTVWDFPKLAFYTQLSWSLPLRQDLLSVTAEAKAFSQVYQRLM